MKNLFYLIISTLFITACSNNNNQTIENTADTTQTRTDSADDFVAFANEMTISNIPFPFELLDKIYSSKITFSQNAMNATGNISKYNQFDSKALNLGIYGADLAYAVTYEKFQLIGNYVKNTKKLAEDLDIPIAFNQTMLDKFEEYKNNKDSLAMVVYDSYSKVDKALKNNERAGMASLVVAGSWLEGLYITTKTFIDEPKSDANNAVYAEVSNQGKHLNTLITMLEEYKTEKNYSPIINELLEIKKDFAANTFDEPLIIALHKKISKLRNSIIEGF